MALCQDCVRRSECKNICQDVKKEIIGRGKTASRKPKTYPIDFSYIENTHQALNSFQKEVLNTMKNLSSDIREQVITKLSIEEAMDKTLNIKEKQIIQFFIEMYKQEEIARTLGISQPRVNFLFKRALRKLRNFLLRGYKTAS